METAKRKVSRREVLGRTTQMAGVRGAGAGPPYRDANVATRYSRGGVQGPPLNQGTIRRSFAAVTFRPSTSQSSGTSAPASTLKRVMWEPGQSVRGR